MHILSLRSLEQNWPFCTEKHRKTKKSPPGGRTELSSTNQIAGKWHHSTKTRLNDITKGYKSACFLGNCVLDRGHRGVNSSRKGTKSTQWPLGMALLVHPALGHRMISRTWPWNRKIYCENSADHAALQMYGNTLYGKRLHVLLSMVQSNCLGERAPPSLALVIRCWVQRFVNQYVFSSQIICNLASRVQRDRYDARPHGKLQSLC